MRNNLHVILTFAFSLLCVEESLSEPFKYFEINQLPDWDYLMYSQRWPISACVAWEEKSKSNVCSLPKDPNTWLVHGLWPTKTGTNGPNKCNSAIHFDPDQLEPLLDDLNNHWTNIEGHTKQYSFWSHEWNKHGTCASVLPQLDSVYNYFKKGLDFNKDFDILKTLSASNIVPNMNNYTIEDISNAVQKNLGKVPQIECIVDSKTKDSLLSEIRLCLNKSFELIDCTSVGLALSNCSTKKPLKYLKDVPGEMAKANVDGYNVNPEEILSREEMLREWYILIKFLIWFTL
ncbi:hypothetical protein WA026_008563 [Henosepilachna vigintioctopunctata]|uniref:Uncharacterized protein n=1 Tax=Henosepilachna vigintioctopunctata TaxID=420089 RepID=A0AAW1UHT0_9CUCU